jgi:hypothetical protein
MICNFLDSSSILCITFLSSLNILAKFLQSTINLTMDRLLLKIFFQVFSLVQLMISPFKVSNNGAKIGLNNGHLSKKCIRFSSSVFTERTVRIYVRDRPFNLQGGGYGFLFRSEIF